MAASVPLTKDKVQWLAPMNSHYHSGSTNVKNVTSQATTSFLKQPLHKLYKNVYYKITDV